MTVASTSPSLLGYTDRLSLRGGETIAFKVSSSDAASFRASLYRSVYADPNPALGGIIEHSADAYFESL